MRKAFEWHRRSAIRSARRLFASGHQPAARQAIEAASLLAELENHPARILTPPDVPSFDMGTEFGVAPAA
jgi:hypothetical protein